MGETRQRRELLQRNFVVLGCFTLRGEDGLRRATFPSSWKSSQKSRKKPMVSSLPCVLCIVQGRDCQPHVHRKCPFSLCYRIVSAPAPLPLVPTTDNASVSTVDNASGSGARGMWICHMIRNQPCSANAGHKVTIQQQGQRGRMLKPKV